MLMLYKAWRLNASLEIWECAWGGGGRRRRRKTLILRAPLSAIGAQKELTSAPVSYASVHINLLPRKLFTYSSEIPIQKHSLLNIWKWHFTYGNICEKLLIMYTKWTTFVHNLG